MFFICICIQEGRVYGVCKTLTQGANEQTHRINYNKTNNNRVWCLFVNEGGGAEAYTLWGPSALLEYSFQGKPPTCTVPPWGKNLSLMEKFLYTPLRGSFEYI